MRMADGACEAPAIIRATSIDRPILTRMGTALDEYSGADVIRANTRRNGQITADSQEMIWPSVNVITTDAFLGLQRITDGMASIMRRKKSTSIVSIQGPAIANTSTAATSLGMNESVAS